MTPIAPANHVSLGAWIRNQWQLDPGNVLGVLQQKRGLCPRCVLFLTATSNMDRPQARALSLDLLLNAGADIEAVGPDGLRAIARVRGPQDNVFTAGGWLPEVVAERVAHALGLLLERGACWDDLEGRVSMEQWQMILDHPVGRRARLEQLACLENNNADVEQQRQL